MKKHRSYSIIAHGPARWRSSYDRSIKSTSYLGRLVGAELPYTNPKGTDSKYRVAGYVMPAVVDYFETRVYV